MGLYKMECALINLEIVLKFRSTDGWLTPYAIINKQLIFLIPCLSSLCNAELASGPVGVMFLLPKED